MKRILILTAAWLLTSMPMAQAANEDDKQPTRVEADTMVYDHAKNLHTFSGNVVLTRGSLLIRAGKVIVSTDKDGYKHATLHGTGDKPANLRQRRDGGADLWVEGHAQRIEYSERNSVADLYHDAQVRRMEGKTVMDEVNGEFITYNSLSESYTVRNSATEGGNATGRVTAVIQPRPEAKKE